MKKKFILPFLAIIATFACQIKAQELILEDEGVIEEIMPVINPVIPDSLAIKAPDFTLKDLEGKDVSLSDYRGKWVVLDFWGSWCPWCIKGFPELKEAYAAYGDKLVIIGIDCRESEEAWRTGVKEYELPWVNVYNPDDSNLTEEYDIQGYPTKFIVNPEGYIKNVTIGHDPVFFDALKILLK